MKYNSQQKHHEKHTADYISQSSFNFVMLRCMNTRLDDLRTLDLFLLVFCIFLLYCAISFNEVVQHSADNMSQK